MDLINKIHNKVRNLIISSLKNKKFYSKLYQCYWHSVFHNETNNTNTPNYYSAIPNSGAGIGHQMANWIAGYWFAHQFGLQFAHTPFANAKWDFFLGFGQDEKNIEKLLSKGYKKVQLPLFDEFNEIEVDLQKQIIASYSSKKVVFIAERDQAYINQYGVLESIQDKFHNAAARQNESIIFDSTNFNIAIHIRRGDIVVGQENLNPNLLMRWQGNDYFVQVLQNVLKKIETDKPIKIYLFSQGTEKDFPEFEQFKNLCFCLDMNAQDSFLHMVFANLLISSKSSFSYKPALLNKGVKVCPKDFWHSYPDTADFVLVDNDGNFEINKFSNHYE